MSTIKKLRAVFTAIILCICLFGSCTSKISLQKINELTQISHSEVAFGASSGFGVASPSVDEAGVFYISDDAFHLLMYYDYNANSSFILCSRSNCEHNSEQCVAYLGNTPVNGGFAKYMSDFYVIKQNSDNLSAELFLVDIENQTKKSIATLGTENPNENDWIVDRIRDVYYCADYAWVQLEYSKTHPDQYGFEQGVQLLSVNLKSGKVNELTDIFNITTEAVSANFELVSPEYVIYRHEWYDEPRLTEAEFAVGKNESEGYLQYIAEHKKSTTQSSKIVQIDLLNNTEKTIWEDSHRSVYDKDGKYIYGNAQMKFYGVYNGNIVCDINGEIGQYEFEIINSNGAVKPSLTIKNGEVPIRYATSANSMIYNESDILYRLNNDDGADYYKYSFEDNSSEKLFSEPEKTELEIIGETDSRLITKIKKGAYAWINKTDFEAGKLEKLNRFYI